MPTGIYKRKPGRKTNKGRKFPNRKRPPSFSKEHRRNMSESSKKIVHTKEWNKSVSKGRLGMKFSDEHRKNISIATSIERPKRRGEKCHFWKGGITNLKDTIKKSFKYRQWRSDVFTRDDFTCQRCFQKGGELCPHHLKAFSIILKKYNIKTLEEAMSCEELWNINNGTTLCRECHKKTDNFGFKLANKLMNPGKQQEYKERQEFKK